MNERKNIRKLQKERMSYRDIEIERDREIEMLN